MIEMMASAAAIRPPSVNLPPRENITQENERKTDNFYDDRSSRHVCLQMNDTVSGAGEKEGNQSVGPTALPSSRQGFCRRAYKTLRRLRSMLLVLSVVLICAVAGSYLCVRYRDQVLEGSEWIRAHAPQSAVYYALITALWIILCLPSTIIELLGGAIFSYPVALLTLTVGKQLGCMLAFLLAKVFASPTLRDALGHSSHSPTRGKEPNESVVENNDQEGGDAPSLRHSRFPAAARPSKPMSKRKRTIRAMFIAMECHPWKITFLLRFLPIPISIKNYGMAFLPCPTHVFFLCTFVASIPFTLIWVNLGESTKNLLEALNGGGAAMKRHGIFAQELGLLVVGLALLMVLIFILRRYTQRYAAVIEAEEADGVGTGAERAGDGKGEEDSLTRADEGGSKRAEDDDRRGVDPKKRGHGDSNERSQAKGAGEEGHPTPGRICWEEMERDTEGAEEEEKEEKPSQEEPEGSPSSVASVA